MRIKKSAMNIKGRQAGWLGGRLRVLLCLVVCMLAACGGESQQSVVPAQHWKDMDVRVETHPNPPYAGMIEIVVIVTGPRGRPIHDLMVSLRGADTAPWVQAIQDGFIGVYRRAVVIGDSGLQVQVLQNGEAKVLLFPLEVQH